MDSYLEQLQQVLESTTTGADPSQMSQAPAGKWNSAQILEHLYLTYRNTNRALGKCLEAGKPLATQAHLKHRVARFVLLTLGYFPSGAKTPERAAPKGMKLEEVKAAIVPEVQSMDVSLAECEQKFGRGTKILDHPILGPLSVDQWRRFHLIHARHHARQIRQRSGAR